VRKAGRHRQEIERERGGYRGRVKECAIKRECRGVKEGG
jgi:hypothetical protein